MREISGRSSVWLERLIWDQEAAGSSPVFRTIKDVYSKPSFRRLWVRAPRKAPLAFLAELVYAFDLKSNYSMLRLVYIGDCCNGSKTGFDPDSGGPTPSSPART